MPEINRTIFSPSDGKRINISLSRDHVPNSPGTQAENAYENNPAKLALNLAKAEKAKSELQTATATPLSKLNETQFSETAENIMREAENSINEVLGLQLNTGLTTQSTSTISSRRNYVDGSAANLTGLDIKATKNISDELNQLIGYMQSNLLTTRNVYVTAPKTDVISKIFILPDWDNDLRNLEDDSVWSTTNFLLQGISEQRAEKYQLIETFGENLIYLYGERPRVYSFSGLLINSEDQNWKNDFLEAYDSKLRGTKCVESKSRAYILYEDVIVEGYILNISHNQQANEAKACPFSITIFVTNQMTINLSAAPTSITTNPNRDQLVDTLKDFSAAAGTSDE